MIEKISSDGRMDSFKIDKEIGARVARLMKERGVWLPEIPGGTWYHFDRCTCRYELDTDIFNIYNKNKDERTRAAQSLGLLPPRYDV